MSEYRFDLLPTSFDAVLVASGSDPGASVFREVIKRSRVHIALDGGTAIFRKHRKVPQYIVGDLDSASKDQISWAKRGGAKILRVNSQHDSDLEKGLNLCRKYKWRQLAILASDGDRPDHSLYAFDSTFRYRDLRSVFISAKSLTYLMDGAFRFELHVPRRHSISWLGFPRAEQCTLKGVKWPFQNRVIETGGFQSLSNVADSKTVSILSNSGRSLLILSLLPEN